MATGDGGCEFYTAIAWGVRLSHERLYIAGAEGFHSLEGNMCGTAMRGADALPGSKATSRAKGSYRNLGDLGSGCCCCMLREYGGPHREGEEPKPMMHGHEKSDLVIVAMKPANKAKEPAGGGICRGKRSGSRGSEGRGPRGMRTGKARTGLSARLARHRRWSAYGQRMCRHTPEVGAVCGKAARTDWGGGRAMKRTSLPLQRRELAPFGQQGVWVERTNTGEPIMSRAITKEVRALVETASEMFDETGCVPGIYGRRRKCVLKRWCRMRRNTSRN